MVYYKYWWHYTSAAATSAPSARSAYRTASLCLTRGEGAGRLIATRSTEHYRYIYLLVLKVSG